MSFVLVIAMAALALLLCLCPVPGQPLPREARRTERSGGSEPVQDGKIRSSASKSSAGVPSLRSTTDAHDSSASSGS